MFYFCKDVTRICHSIIGEKSALTSVKKFERQFSHWLIISFDFKQILKIQKLSSRFLHHSIFNFLFQRWQKIFIFNLYTTFRLVFRFCVPKRLPIKSPDQDSPKLQTGWQKHCTIQFQMPASNFEVEKCS